MYSTCIGKTKHYYSSINIAQYIFACTSDNVVYKSTCQYKKLHKYVHVESRHILVRGRKTVFFFLLLPEMCIWLSHDCLMLLVAVPPSLFRQLEASSRRESWYLYWGFWNGHKQEGLLSEPRQSAAKKQKIKTKEKQKKKQKKKQNKTIKKTSHTNGIKRTG